MKALQIVMVLLIAVICILPVLVVKQAQAAPAWAICYVNATGPGGASKYVQLTDANGSHPAIKKTWYSLSNSYSAANAFLATALTAMVSGMKVQVYVTDTAANSQVTTMYLMDK
jgi:hypothetical protein